MHDLNYGSAGAINRIFPDLSSTPYNSANQYCHNCGAPLPPGALFCPRCGTAVPSTQSTGAPPPPYYDRQSYRDWRRQQRRSEKDEKNEKGEKGEKAEKGGGGGALLGGIIGGAILIWLGISFYLQEIGYLAAFNWWALFIAGIGVILIFQGVYLYTRSRKPIIGPLIGGGILLVIGLAFFFNSFVNLWPLILVIIGLAIVASAFGARRRTPPPT